MENRAAEIFKGMLPPLTGRRFLPFFSESCSVTDLSSNDYLGLGKHPEYRKMMYDLSSDNFTGSLSSRLLYAGSPVYEELEYELAGLYGKEAALLFNSGYHANMGILPALTSSLPAGKKALIVADKLVHASIIDGMRLCECDRARYRHNDMNHLERILEKGKNVYDLMIIVSESVFSMDGDVADIVSLARLRKRYPSALIYLDEAHAFGIYGDCGRGKASDAGCLADIDILVGTFGKAAASYGAFAVTSSVIRDLLVNRCRSLIFSTALPPLSAALDLEFVRALGGKGCLSSVVGRQRNLFFRNRDFFSESFFKACRKTGRDFRENGTNIFPYITGDDGSALELASVMRDAGFYIRAVRPPTVPPGTSRLRISVNASLSCLQMEKIVALLEEYHEHSKSEYR